MVHLVRWLQLGEQIGKIATIEDKDVKNTLKEVVRGTIAQNVKMGMCAKARAGEW